MNEISDKNHTSEKYFYKSMIYIEELITEFGVLHPLVDKTIEGFINRIVNNNSNLSEDLSLELARYLERWLARKDKAIEEQRQLTEERSKASWFNLIALSTIFLGIGVFFYRCFKKDNPVQVLHHHFGSVTDNVNINYTGNINEYVNLKIE